MKKLILIYLTLAAAIYAGLHIEKDPGYALFALGQWTVEMPLWFFATSVIVLFGLVHLCFNFMHYLGGIRRQVYLWRSRWSLKASKNKTKQGLIAYSEANWHQAEKQLLKGLLSCDAPLVNYLMAARAAQEQGKTRQRDKYLREAEKDMPEAKIAILLTQAELQLNSKQYEQAFATLNHLGSQLPNHPHVLKLKLSLYKELEDWPELAKLLPQLVRYKILSELERQKLEKQITFGEIDKAYHDNSHGRLLQIWQQLSKPMQKDIDLIKYYVQKLMAMDEAVQAGAVLKQSLKKQWNEELIFLYGQLPHKDVERALKVAEGFIKSHTDSANLYLTLGVLCKKLQLWGKSKDYLETSIQLKPSVNSYFELGELFRLLKNDIEASTHFEHGLELALNKSSTQAKLPQSTELH